MLKRAAMAAAITLLAAPLTFAQGNSREELQVLIGETSVTIEYGRPSLKGRDMLGRAQVGATWRFGADAATTFKATGPLKAGAQSVPAGDYVMSAKKVSESEWHLLLSQGDSVIAVPLTASELPESVELFTIKLSEAGEFHASWGTHSLAASFSAE